MPSNWLSIDSNFPSFTGEESEEQQIRALHNYLFQLREGLQYSLQNLTADNFNTAALQNLTDAQKDEVTLQLEKVYTQLNQMTTEIDRLSSRVNGTENLSGRVTAAEGEISALKGRVKTTEENVEGMTEWNAAIQTDLDDLQGRTAYAEEALEDLTGRVQAMEDDKTLDDLKEIVDGEDGLRDRTQSLEKAVTGEGGLQEQQTELTLELEKLSGVVQVAEDGGATVGSEEKPLYLVGKIYINGVLYEQGGTT